MSEEAYEISHRRSVLYVHSVQNLFASLMSEESYECSRLTWSYNVSAIEFPNQFAPYMYCAHVLGIIYYH